ncbi:MAG: hypothetical protein HUJ54_14270, partial [Erysipelotrichaceae bacterium]|nr:hypothetical protein [Erysipelotrichaceae bacterium]
MMNATNTTVPMIQPQTEAAQTLQIHEDNGQQFFGPVLQIERQSGMIRLHFREDVDLEKSLWFWNGKAVQDTELFMDQDGLWNLSYELCSSDGQVLESSEQSFVQDVTVPVISWNASQEDLWVYESSDLLWQVSDDNPGQTTVFIDGSPVESDGLIRLTRRNRHVLIRSVDAFGNTAQKELNIHALPAVISPWASHPSFTTQDSTLQFELEGDWQGMVLELNNSGSVMTVPFESAHLKITLPDGQPVTLTLVHPEQGALQSWNVTKESAEPEFLEEEVWEPEEDVTETAPEAVPAAPEAEAAPAVQQVQPAAAGLQEITADTSSAVFALARPAIPAVSAPVQASLKVDGRVLQPGQSVFFEKISDVSASVENGSFKSLSYQIKDASTGRTFTYDKLDDALKKHPDQKVEALIQAADGNGSELSQSFSLIPQGSPVLLEKTSGLALLQSSFSLNAQGKIEIASSRQAKNAALLLANGIPFQYAKVTAGQELQL